MPFYSTEITESRLSLHHLHFYLIKNTWFHSHLYSMTMPAGSIDASDPFSMWTKVDHDEIWRGGWNETTYMIWRGETNIYRHCVRQVTFLFVSTLQKQGHDSLFLLDRAYKTLFGLSSKRKQKVSSTVQALEARQQHVCSTTPKEEQKYRNICNEIQVSPPISRRSKAKIRLTAEKGEGGFDMIFQVIMQVTSISWVGKSHAS